MNNTTITLWVNPTCEMYFWQLIKQIDSLPIEATFTWNPIDIQISKAMISNWIWINMPVDTYLKFTHSLIFNKGKFI